MKKYLALLLAAVLCFVLCACGGNKTETNTSNKATIVTNEGITVEKTVEELFNEFDENEARFSKLYSGAMINFVGTVKNIKTNTDVYAGPNSVAPEQNKIVFEEGITLIIGRENTDFDLANYYTGQKLKVVSYIVGAPFDTEFLKTISDNNRTLWLVGNDTLNYKTYNQFKTQITPV